MKLGKAGLGIVLALGTGAPAFSANIKSIPGRAGSVIILVSGGIAPGDGDALIDVIKKAEASGKSVESVRLNSFGGNLGEGAKLATVIKLVKLSTVVPSGAVCASACFLAFAAGEQKFAGEGALIGVHKAADRSGAETKQSSAATTLMAQFAKELGVSNSIITRMVTTPPTQIGWLEQRELHSMGVRTLGRNVEPTQIVRETVIVAPKPATSAPMTGLAKPTTDRPSWDEFVQKTTTLSAEQNDGNAGLRRACRPELKECIVAVAYRLPDGRQGLAMTIEDESGYVIRREVCENNTANDARDCVNWDNGAKYRDIKDAAGAWVQSVAEQ